MREEEAFERQKQGRPGTLVDPRPETLPSGEIKIVITPQMVHDIFEEFPVVSQAYNENVPSTVSFISSTPLNGMINEESIAFRGHILATVFPIEVVL